MCICGHGLRTTFPSERFRDLQGADKTPDFQVLQTKDEKLFGFIAKVGKGSEIGVLNSLGSQTRKGEIRHHLPSLSEFIIQPDRV